jgi:phospho-2-dehydro-3-deoxyheptonate aldolase
LKTSTSPRSRRCRRRKPAQQAAADRSGFRDRDEGREALRNIIDRKDKRLFVVVGPCSIHDPVAGLDYARRLKALQAEVADTMLLVMRVYFEKPRTTTGWKGYINDPDMDDSFRVDVGMEKRASSCSTCANWACPPPPKRWTRSRRNTWAT